MKTPLSLLSLLLLVQLLSWGHIILAQEAPPNVVLIVVDDMRYDEYGAGGHPYLQTPAIDQLALEGSRFTNAYHAVPLCSPNRASILTGQYPSRHGIIDNTARNQASHMLDLFPKELQEAGYRTAHVGKWHMGNRAEPRPGYDYWVSFEGQGKTYDPTLFEEGQFRQVEGYITDIFTDRIVDFITASAENEQPFFAYLGHKAIHPEAVQRDDGTVDTSVPMAFIPAKRHEGIYKGQIYDRSPGVPDRPEVGPGKPVIKQALALKEQILADNPSWNNVIDMGIAENTIQKRAEMMLAVDESVGRIKEALENSGVMDNTVIIFTSDNGYFYGEHGFSIERRMPYQESIRTPLLVYSPLFGNQAREVEGLTLSIDLAATILDLATGNIPTTVQGKSLVPLLSGTGQSIRSSAYIEYYSHENPMTWTASLDYRVVIKGDYKLIKWLRFENELELYQLAEDPYELTNLASVEALQPIVEDLLNEMRNGQLFAMGLNE